jgi:UDP-glucose 4-epimerase
MVVTMKVLVTGSSGTIGTRLCEALLARGDTVIGADWLENKWNPEIQKLTVNVDLRDAKAIKANASKLKADVIVHLAANARVYELVEHPDRALDNFITLFNTLEFARTNDIKKFVFASSRESYGNTGAEKLTEDMVRVENCESPYTASKVGGEALVEAYSRCYGIDHITFRFSNVYGMYDDSVRVVPLFIRLARKNEAMTVFGKDKCLDFTYIDDTVAGIMLGLDNFESAKNDSYNLAYGEGTTILALAEDVKKLLKSDSKIEMGVARTGEVIRYIADISKAKKTLGYKPKTPFSEGIKKSVEWYLKNTK